MAASESSTFLHMEAKDSNPYGDDDMLGLMPPNELENGLGYMSSEPHLIPIAESADASDIEHTNIDIDRNPRTESRDTFGGTPKEQ